MPDVQRIERALPMNGGIVSDTNTTGRQWDDMENLLPRMGGGPGLKPRNGVLWLHQFTTSVTEGCVVFLAKLDDVTDRKLVVLMNASTGQIVIMGELAEQYGRAAQEAWTGGVDPDDPAGDHVAVSDNALPWGHCEPFIYFAPEDDSVEWNEQYLSAGVAISVADGGTFTVPVIARGNVDDIVQFNYIILNSSGALATAEVNAPQGQMSAKVTYSGQLGGLNSSTLEPLVLTVTAGTAAQAMSLYLFNPTDGQIYSPSKMVINVT